MSEKKTSIVSILNIILLIIYFFTIILFAFIDDSAGMDLNRNKIATFNDGWSISYNNIIEDDILLPQNYHFKPNSPYSIERIINKKDFIYSTIRIRSSMMDVKAYIDDQLIYDFDIESNYKGFQLPYPSSWQLINIPIDKSIGKTLKITFSSPTTQFSGLINTIMIGEGEAIILNILKENFLNLIISILIIFLSVVVLLTLFRIKQVGIKRHILYLASFGIAAGFWIISESTLLQLITSNRFLISSISYILNLVLPLIIVLFFRDIIFEGFKKLMTFISTLIVVLLTFEMILQFTGYLFFISSTLLSILMISISSISIIFCLIYEGYKKNNLRARHYIFVFLTLFIVAAIIMGLFVFGVYQNLEKYLSLGVFGFFLIVMSDVIKSINGLVETKNNSLIYKKLAYEDYLTKGWNRTAFEQDIENLINNKTIFRLILFDLNHLKLINDSYGHIEGDYAILESYNSIKEIVKENGKSYRISGDEFACILYDINNDIFEKFSNILSQKLKEKSNSKPYDIVLAFGSKIYNDSENFTTFYKEVDKEMYKHKKRLKAIAFGN